MLPYDWLGVFDFSGNVTALLPIKSSHGSCGYCDFSILHSKSDYSFWEDCRKVPNWETGYVFLDIPMSYVSHLRVTMEYESFINSQDSYTFEYGAVRDDFVVELCSKNGFCIFCGEPLMSSLTKIVVCENSQFETSSIKLTLSGSGEVPCEVLVFGQGVKFLETL